jgi:mRNA-degrading endonuclease RelE of RelBE toxin-antitoxin system
VLGRVGVEAERRLTMSVQKTPPTSTCETPAPSLRKWKRRIRKERSAHFNHHAGVALETLAREAILTISSERSRTNHLNMGRSRKGYYSVVWMFLDESDIIQVYIYLSRRLADES